MTATTDFDRTVAGWLETAGPSDIRAEMVDNALATARSVRPRRGLSATILGPSPWPVVGRRPRIAALPARVRIAIVFALTLIAVAGVALLVAGALRRSDPPIQDGLMVWTENGDGGGTIHVLSADGSSALAVDLASVHHCPHVLAGAGRVAFYGAVPNALTVHSFDPASVDIIIDSNHYEEGSAVWSPDERRVVLGSGIGGGARRIVDLMDGAVHGIALDGTYLGAAWAANGDLAIAQQLETQASIVDVDSSGAVRRELARFPWSPTVGNPAMSWSPDGRRLVHAVREGLDAEVVDVESGRATRISGDSLGLDVSTSTWSPDGTRLAMLDGTFGLLISGTDGTSPVVIRLPEPGHRAAWSPGGTAIAIQGSASLMTVRTDGSGVVATQIAPLDWSFSWAPDGSWIAIESSSEPGSVAVDLYAPDTLTKRSFVRLDGDIGWLCTTWDSTWRP